LFRVWHRTMVTHMGRRGNFLRTRGQDTGGLQQRTSYVLNPFYGGLVAPVGIISLFLYAFKNVAQPLNRLMMLFPSG
jgi:hypothetical protein